MSSPPPVDPQWLQAIGQFQRGEFESARRAAEAVVARQPHHSPAHLLLANVASQQGRHRRVVEHAIAASVRMGPQPLRHVADVAFRLIAAGEYFLAASLIRKIDPTRTPAPTMLAEFAQQLSLLEQHDDALRYLQAALTAGLSGDQAQYLLGNFLKFLGRLDDAAQAYERSLRINPGNPFSHLALAYLGRAGDPARIARIRQALAASAADAPGICYLHYALFKELDGTDDSDGAWRALEAGFKAKRKTLDYDAGAEWTIYQQVMAACGAGYCGDPEDAGDRATPIFILGLPRTGTTLLERVLGGHRDVALCGELNDFRMQYKWETDHYCTGFFDETAVARIGQVDPVRLGQRYLGHVGWRAPDARYFTDKNPGNFMMIGPILRSLPHARILHLRRNAMDSCFSNLKELFGGDAHPYSYDLADLAGHYRNYSRLMSHWHAIAPGRILDVRYEDLVSEPEATARAVMAFCGLDYDPIQVDIQANDAPVSTASSAQVRQPIHRRNIGGWKRYASQLAPLQALLGDAG